MATEKRGKPEESATPRSESVSTPEHATAKTEAGPKGMSFPIVGVGASAGGVDAFIQLLKALPPDTGMAFVMVPHLDPSHGSAMAEILGRNTAMPVMQVNDEPLILPNH